ncbi:MAG: hypothetical protein ACRD1X_18030 [Vicinamibacteria bacterium]
MRARMLRGLGDFCTVVPVEDAIMALVELGYMTPEHQSYRDLDEAYRRWYTTQGLDPFASGPFDNLIDLEGVSQLKICPESAWQLLSSQAAGAAAAAEASGRDVVHETPPPAAPPPAPRREAGFTPEASPWAWAFVATVVGGTWLYVRHDRRTRGR